jgi:peptidoglycan/LPS O-acetylase OafA/YrhL
MSKTPSGQFATLDGMRGVGAVLVVMGHGALFFGNVDIAVGGPVLVDAFFMFSGFVIAYAYEPRFAAGMGVRSFMVQRLIRLMPLAMLATLLGYICLALCVRIFDDDISQVAMLARVVPEMFLIPAVTLGANDDLFKFNVPLWSLLFEILANVIYVLMIPILTRRVLIATVVFSGIILALLSIAHGTTDGGSELLNAPVGMARAAFGFFAGVLIYRFAGSPRQPRTNTTWMALVPMFALVPIAFIPPQGDLKPLTQLLAIMAVAPLVVFLGQRLEPPRFLHPIMRWTGEVSFAVYVFHWPLLMVLRYYEEANPGSLTSLGPIVGILFLAVVVLVSWVLSTFVDAPLRKWLMQLTRRQKTAVPRPVGS